MSDMSVSCSGIGTVSHNGPICATCGARYIGSHTCSPADIIRRINELLALLSRTSTETPWSSTEPLRFTPAPWDQTANCPCRPENGGSGVCGCILSGPTVTCSAAS